MGRCELDASEPGQGLAAASCEQGS